MASPLFLGPNSSFSFLAPSIPPQPHQYPTHYFPNLKHGFHFPPLLTLCITVVTLLAIFGVYCAISTILTQCLAVQARLVESLPAEPPLAEVELEPVPVAPLPTQAPPADDAAEASPIVQVVPPPVQAEATPLTPTIVVSG